MLPGMGTLSHRPVGPTWNFLNSISVDMQFPISSQNDLKRSQISLHTLRLIPQNMVAALKTLANSLSSFPPVSLAVTPNLDRAIRKARTVSYPKYVLYYIAGFIALMSLSHFLSLGYRYATRNRASNARLRTSISVFRLPAALVDSLRALVFRWTVPVGSSFTLSLAELTLALCYIALLFSWTFVGSRFLEIYRF
jgi:hypothetical protein